MQRTLEQLEANSIVTDEDKQRCYAGYIKEGWQRMHAAVVFCVRFA